MINVQFINSDDAFSSTLTSRVEQYLAANKSPGVYKRATIRSLAIGSLIVGLYAFILWTHATGYLACFYLSVLGVLVIVGGTNILHEATHGNLSQSKFVNRLFAYFYECIVCFSCKQYKLRHLMIHHAFTNLGELDYDLDTNGALRLSPCYKTKSLHRFQHLYVIFLYCIGALHIAWINDVQRLFSSKVGMHSHSKWRVGDFVMQLSSKLLHASDLVLPMCLYPAQYVLLAYLFVFAVSGLGIALIFQVSHVNTQVKFFDVDIQDQNAVVHKDWYCHQLQTTANYSASSAFVRFLTGGVNLQTEHHLFPRLPYARLVEIRPIVKQVCEEFSVPYYEYSSYFKALRDHFLMLKRLGCGASVEVEDA